LARKKPARYDVSMKPIDRQAHLKKIAHCGQEALALAAELDDLRLVEAALSMGADPDGFGRGWPLRVSGPRCALTLLRAGAHPERRPQGMTAWLRALDERQWEKALALAPHCDKAAVDEKGRDGLMLALRACEKEPIDASGELVDSRARSALGLALTCSEAGFKAKDGSTALMSCVQSVNGLLSKELIERAVAAGRLNDRDAEGFTALARATRSKRTAAVEALLGAGADPLLANEKGVTPLMLAARVGAAREVEILGAWGGIQARCRDGWSALEHAMASGGRGVDAVWRELEKAGPGVAGEAAERARAWANSNKKAAWEKKAREEWAPRAESLELAAACAAAPSRGRSLGL
jgi:hypothetical protein